MYASLELKIAFFFNIVYVPSTSCICKMITLFIQQCLLHSMLDWTIPKFSTVKADWSSVHDIFLLPSTCHYKWVDDTCWESFSTHKWFIMDCNPEAVFLPDCTWPLDIAAEKFFLTSFRIFSEIICLEVHICSVHPFFSCPLLSEPVLIQCSSNSGVHLFSSTSHRKGSDKENIYASSQWPPPTKPPNPSFYPENNLFFIVSSTPSNTQKAW